MVDPYQECPHGVLYEVGRGPESQCLTCRTADHLSPDRIEQGLCARVGCLAHNRHLAGYCSPECYQAHVRTQSDDRIAELEAENARLQSLMAHHDDLEDGLDEAVEQAREIKHLRQDLDAAQAEIAEKVFQFEQAEAEAERLRDCMRRACAGAVITPNVSAKEMQPGAVVELRDTFDLVAAERDNLKRWKREAMEVSAQWDRVATELGLDDPRPDEIGKSMAVSALARVERLKAERDALERSDWIRFQQAWQNGEAAIKAEAQRDELSDALRGIRGVDCDCIKSVGGCPSCTRKSETARAALAKLEGNGD